MITVMEQPNDAVLVRNDVKYKLYTTNHIVNAGQKASIQIQVSSFSNAGTITFNFMGKTYVFNSTSGTDDNSGLQFYDGSGYSSYLSYAQAFKLWLERNFDLNSNYDIIIVGSFPLGFVININAKKVGVKYDITASASTSGGFVNFVPQASGIDAVYRERFKVLHDVFLEETFGALNYKLLFSGSGVPDAENNVEFNFTDVLRGALQLHTPVFAPTDFYLNNSVKKFYTRHAESFGFPTTVKAYKNTGVKMAFLGGQKFVNAAQQLFYTNYFDVMVKPFLTAMPQNTVVTKEQKQYLSCYVDKTMALKFNIRLFYTDGTYGNHLLEPAMDIPAEGVYTFECGYQKLTIDTIKTAGKTVSKYIVELYDSDEEPYVSEQAFVVDHNNTLFNRYILFFNSFGMPETMYFSGKQSNNTQLKNDLVRKANLQADADNGIYDGEMAEINNELLDGYELNSGWKSEAWQQYFKDFLLSRKRYLQATDKWIGLNIPAQKVALLEDDKYNYAVKFNYQDSFIEKGIAE
jgi:hypothetical protein